MFLVRVEYERGMVSTVVHSGHYVIQDMVVNAVYYACFKSGSRTNEAKICKLMINKIIEN